MLVATFVHREEIKAEIVQRTWNYVHIVVERDVEYRDTITGKTSTRLESDTIVEFPKAFLDSKEAEKWMKKDKMFKATLKAALKYTERLLGKVN